ncbi:MAG TPA: hypothetical protein VMF56_14415 [Acidobacteriaceae bacterium]|nr:hypothetical protein [Acidobacteriaceae bacterium]
MPPPVPPKLSEPDLCDPAFWLYLSVAAEHILQNELRAAVRERRDNGVAEQDLWNELFRLGLKTVDAHAQRLQMEAFVDFATTAAGGSSTGVGLLLVLHAIRVVEQDSAWYVANKLLSFDQLKQFGDLMDALSDRLFPLAPALIEEFGLDDLLQVPILDPALIKR